MNYDVFISYSRKDYVDDQKNVIPENDVLKIKTALSEAGITYWFDEEGIYSGQNFVEKIVTNIENARIFLFLSTSNSNKSPWTCKEIASADEFKKHIIPVRIDSSPYNKKVLFRIADLDYIEYYTNPKKGIEDLIKSIKTYLTELTAEERRKKEEEKRKQEEERLKKKQLELEKEQEAKRLQEEQERLVSEIKLSCIELNNEEAKLEIERENLILKTRKVIEDSSREALVSQIKEGGVIYEKFRNKCSSLEKEVRKLQSVRFEHSKDQDHYKLSLMHDIEDLKKRLSDSERLRNDLEKKYEDLKNAQKQSKYLERFLEIIRYCLFEKYTSFKGRATRFEFWNFVLFMAIVIIVVVSIGMICGCIYDNRFDDSAIFFGVWFGFIVNLGLICPYVSVSVRRLHDIGFSGWWWWINFIPWVGAIAFIVLCCLESKKDNNKYSSC